MTYTHLTTNELTIIAHSFVQKLKAYRVAQMINRSAETVYRVYRYLETGASIADYQDHYMRNKQRCGRKRTQLSLAELTYINDKIAQGWTADAINQHLSQWLRKFPRYFFKSITFDNGKEFAGWREIANQFDLHTYFAEVGAPNQRGLNENNNGLLRRDGLTKRLNFRNLPDELVTQLMSKRNNLPRKSLGYRTPYEVFMSYVTDEQLLSF